ncbi:MAG: ribosome silencing factor [Pseudomonadota bacterium]
MEAEKFAEIAVSALEDIKARDITVIDVSLLTSLFDRMIIASADSTRQTKALANNVQVEIKAAGGTVLSIEGEQSGEWVLVDCGSVIIHIMQPAVRQYYNLEELWGARLPMPIRHGAEKGKSAAEFAASSSP